MLKLKQMGQNEWEFVHPEGYRDTLDMLQRGCDLYEVGDFVEAEEIFKTVVREIPDHLDGLHHWALVREKLGDLSKAKDLWEKAVSMGKKTFAENFRIGKDLLIWGFLDNRPFLRCMQGLGLTVLKTGDIKRANKIFMDMLRLNPNDNQGIRANAIETFFYLKQHEEVLKICDSYPYDGMADTLYGRALAYFQLKNKKMADKSLTHAIECLPKVAKEMIKTTHKKPKSLYPGTITVGGKDEAYYYWKRNDINWKSTSGAVDWVKTTLLGKVNIKVNIEVNETVIYQFKIKLKHIKPPIWRGFKVKSDITLYKLYIILLKVMGWTGGHLHQFVINNRYYGTPDPEYDTFHKTIDEKKVKLKDIIQHEKQKFIFEYDFGDGWEHEVVVKKILPYEKDVQYPVCLKGKRACPPEDCGGPWGYMEFLEAIQTPKHPEHKSWLEWVGGSFDSEEFNLEETNELLKDIEKKEPWFEDFV